MDDESITPTIVVGDILTLTVSRFGKKGDPIMVHKGFIIFLKDFKDVAVRLNKMIEIKITKVLPNFAFAERTKNEKD